MDFTAYRIYFMRLAYLIVSIFLISNPGITNNAYADRQADLEAQFDIVDTFDGLANWRGATGANYDFGTMPKKQGGSASIWSYYANDSAAADDWIKDHGPDYRLGPAGKSLCINVKKSAANNDGYGPYRIGTYFGPGSQKPKDYKKIYIFFMVRFRPGFFSPNSGTECGFVEDVDLITVSTGFTTIGTWGTASEQDMACSSTDRFLNVYGMQGTTFNLFSNEGSTLFSLRQSSWRAMRQAGCYINPDFETNINLTGTGFNATLNCMDLKNNWIGIEFIVDIGTLGNNDASTAVYLYNSSGAEVGHFPRSGYGQLVQFDHRLNKIIIGGRRSSIGGSSENRFYVDDFIIHGSRIGPTYFSIVNGVPPSPPTNLNVVGINQ